MSMSLPTVQQNAITCPECGNSVVPLGINNYHCISCKFERNFNKPEQEEKGTMAPVIAVITAILLLLMI